MPTEIRTSFLLWLVAIGAGVFETVLVVLDAMAGPGGLDGGLLVGVGVRLTIFLVMPHVITQMALGHNWARVALAVLIGGFGTLSLVAGPIQWLAAGHTPAAAIAAASASDLLLATSRIGPATAAVAATWYMFRPEANRYFRSVAQRHLSRV
jgi:hypothetical protein